MKIKQLLVSLFVALFMATGPVWAGDIVDLNTATVDDLLNVKGIGEKSLAKIRGSVEVGGHGDKEKASH